ncbi:MAG TPA: Gfo/Idh/MocA family oxidoreductase [Candidatus Atribacteria bacterium]|nr:Gfo/Idh/MocA family oxidoreductase [Candidatus Atribacteria bacterium]
MDNSIRIGIVGCGFAAEFHYTAYQRVTDIDIEVVGITSLTREHRKDFAKKRGIKSFDSLEEMLPEVNVIDVCTPGYVHEEVSITSLEAGKHIVVEKPFTGYFGSQEDKNFKGNKFSKGKMLESAVASARRIIAAALKSKKKLCYAENWIYAPAIQKEAEIITKTKGQILWALGDQSHSGSLSPAYGIWRLSGGGSMVGKSCHPLTAVLYLKQIEGLARNGKAIRPQTVSARTHEITRNPKFIDKGFLRTDYEDIEDYCQLHVIFNDGMIADIFASELVMGGVHNWLEIFANNHRTKCNLSPVNAMELYNPQEEQLKDVYVMEKIGTKQGWSHPTPDENFMFGYPQEIQDFMEAIATDREPKSGMLAASDVVSVLYAAYLSAECKGTEVEIRLDPSI